MVFAKELELASGGLEELMEGEMGLAHRFIHFVACLHRSSHDLRPRRSDFGDPKG